MQKFSYLRFLFLLFVLHIFSMFFLCISHVCFPAPFTSTTANVSAVFDTQATPIGWTFNIWALIYIFLIGMNVYIIAGLCRM